jgi:branched-subunit amino acid ABC-type transport system permease component
LFNRLLVVVRRIWSNKITQLVFSFLLSVIIFNIFGGLVGNTAYSGALPAWFKTMWGQLVNVLTVHFSVITFCIAFISIVGFSTYCTGTEI